MLSRIFKGIAVVVVASSIGGGIVLAFGLKAKVASVIQAITPLAPPPDVIALILAGLFGLAGLIIWELFRVEERLRNYWRARPFVAEVRVAIVDVGKSPVGLFMAVRDTNGNKIASPIGFLLYIQVANRQEFPIQIDSFLVAASDFARGPWTPLSNIRLQGVEVVATGVTTQPLTSQQAQLEKSGKVVLSPALEVELKKQLEPHNAVAGWAVFDREETVKSKTPKYYKVSLRDTNGTMVDSVSSPRPTEETQMTTAMMRPIGRIDLSSAVIRPYRNQ